MQYVESQKFSHACNYCHKIKLICIGVTEDSNTNLKPAHSRLTFR